MTQRAESPEWRQELLRGLQAGREESFRELLRTYLQPVYAFLVHLTRDPAAAEDLAQETFIKAWKHLARFDPGKSLKVWLFAIAKNTAYDFLRKKKTIPFSSFENESGESSLENVEDTVLLPDALLERQDIAEKVEHVLALLSPDARTILVLHYREGFSLGEMAEILGLPYNTVKSRHRRAILSFKKAFLREGGTPFGK